MFAILGSGFGLYGYLPALAAESELPIVLPERYRKRFGERPELWRFQDSIRWEPDEEAALRVANGVAMALPPIVQREWLHRSLSMLNVERLLLEKPLAESPETARSVLDALLRARRVFRLGYTFRYTQWGESFSGGLRAPGQTDGVAVQWRFLAHHYRHGATTWKRFNAEGGGAVRFYGIHLIALLAETGYRGVATSHATGPSSNEYQQWDAVFTGPGLPVCEVVVDTRSPVTGFSVDRVNLRGNGVRGVCANGATPFQSRAHLVEVGDLDERVPLVRRVCRSLLNETTEPYDWYDSTLTLWSHVEAATEFEEVSAQQESR